MAPEKGNCPCCDAAADEYVLECDKCKKWIHFACFKLPAYMLVQFDRSSRVYSCLTCVHERFMNEFPKLHDTFEEVISKQNKSLRSMTADTSSQTDPPASDAESEPTQVDTPPLTQPIHLPPTTDQQKDTAQVTDHQSNDQQDNVDALPDKPTPTPPNSVILGLNVVNSNESRESLPDEVPANKHEPKKSTSDAPPKTPSCKFYLQGRCRHGRIGKDCSFVHPPMCHKFIKNGEKSCNKGSECKYVHPKLCIRSLNTKECLKVTCSFYHVAGTRRNSDGTQTPQKLMSINTGISANQHVPATSHPTTLPHPYTQPTSSNVPNPGLPFIPPPPSFNPPSPSNPNTSHLPQPISKPPSPNPNISTYQNPVNHPSVPSGLPSCFTQTNQHNAIPTTSAPNTSNSDSSIFLGQLRDIKSQMSQMMEFQNYLLKFVMKQEWPSLPKHSHMF